MSCACSRSASARLVTWLLAYIPLALWVTNYAGQIWLWPGLTAILAVYLIQLVVNVDAAGSDVNAVAKANAKIQAHLLAHQYEGLIKKARLRGRGR